MFQTFFLEIKTENNSSSISWKISSTFWFWLVQSNSNNSLWGTYFSKVDDFLLHTEPKCSVFFLHYCFWVTFFLFHRKNFLYLFEDSRRFMLNSVGGWIKSLKWVFTGQKNRFVCLCCGTECYWEHCWAIIFPRYQKGNQERDSPLVEWWINTLIYLTGLLREMNNINATK